MIRNIIDNLITKLDAYTLSHTQPFQQLVLTGDLAHSPFLRAVTKKADKLGINYTVTTERQFKYPTVIDRETSTLNYIPELLDLDHAYTDGMSCVAEAIYLLLDEYKLISGKNITIVGRGHSVKGLADKLLEEDATITIAHSRTESLLQATMGRDVVIYATPRITDSIAYDTKHLVIDVGRCVEHPDWFYGQYTSDIGRLTVSVLLNRFVHGGF